MKTSYYSRGTKLYYRVSHKGFIYRAAVPSEFNLSQWNAKAQLFSTDLESNKKLLDFKKHLEKELRNLLNIGVPLIGKAIKEIESEFFNPTQKEYFLSEFLVLFKGLYINDTELRQIQALQNVVEDMPTVILSQIDYKWMLNFRKHLLNLSYSPNTVNKNTGLIKRAIRYANKLDLKTKLSALSIESLTTEVISQSLTESELSAIFKATMPTESLQNVQKLFLISCTTALRVSDLMLYAKQPDKFITADGDYIQMIAKKTKQPLLIPIDPRVRNFIKDVRPIHQAKYNKYLKVVMKLCGINENVQGYLAQINEEGLYRRVYGTYEKWECISSHTGRRTYATLMFGKLPTSIIRGITGHSTEASFLRYVNKRQSESALEVKRFYDKMYKETP